MIIIYPVTLLPIIKVLYKVTISFNLITTSYNLTAHNIQCKEIISFIQITNNYNRITYNSAVTLQTSSRMITLIN